MRFPLFVILFLVSAALCSAQQLSDFNGTWVLKYNGQAVLKLTIAASGTNLSGSLTKPKQMTIDQDGTITGVGPEQVKLPIQDATWRGGRLDLTIDDENFVMTLGGHDQATVVLKGMSPWHLERAPEGSGVTLATSLREPEYSPEIRALENELSAMVKEDQDARLAYDRARMEAADTRNRQEVLRIFDKYGWVTNSLAGREAAHNFWLLVQHQSPDIQQRLLPALEKAAKSGDASMTDYAYLYDRVQMGLGKPQHWGTQARCEDGKPALYEVDDPAGLDERRRELFMMPIDEYLKNDYLAEFCAKTAKQE